MMRGRNDWAVEALAELAAYELAFPEKNRERSIAPSVYSETPYDAFNGTHEYSMACYLDYLLRQCDASFADMWAHVAGSSKTWVSTSLNDFFGSKWRDFGSLEQSYPGFWRDVAGDIAAPRHSHLQDLFIKRVRLLAQNEHSVVFKYQADAAHTTAFNLFAPRQFAGDRPVRIFVAESVLGSRNGAWITPVTGITSYDSKVFDRLGDARVPGGYTWAYLAGADDSSSPAYEIYQFRKDAGDVLLVALESEVKGDSSSVRLTEVQARSLPERLDDAAVGEEHDFAFAFKDIPGCIKSTEIVIDFGDGQFAHYKQQNTTSEGQPTGTLYGTVKHAFSAVGETTVKCSLYDGFESDERLIAQVTVPVAVMGEVTTTTTPEVAPPATDTPVTASPVTKATDAGMPADLDGDWSGTFMWDGPRELTLTFYVIEGAVKVRWDLLGFGESEEVSWSEDTVTWVERIEDGEYAEETNTWTGNVARGEDGCLVMTGTVVKVFTDHFGDVGRAETTWEVIKEE